MVRRQRGRVLQLLRFVLVAAQVQRIHCGPFDQDIPVASMTTPTGIRILGSTTSMNFGSSVSNAGDVNGDKIGDMLVGAPTYLTNTGIVYVLFGRSSIRDTFDFDMSGFVTGPTTGFTVLGAATSTKTGQAVGAAGDINNDGLDDILIGAPTVNNAGAVYVIFGRNVPGGDPAFIDINLASGLLSTVGFTILGAAAADNAGCAVGAAGDVNGDGIDDIIVGASMADPPALAATSNAGIAYVVFGRDVKKSGVPFADYNLGTSISPSTGFRMMCGSASGSCGVSVAGIGDINGDGVDDVITGASGVSTGVGAAYIVFGRNTNAGGAAFEDVLVGTMANTVGFRMVGSDTNDALGGAVSLAGDVNGDGIKDFIVAARFAEISTQSATFNSGIAYIIYGRSSQATAFADLPVTTLTNSVGFRIIGAALGNQLGNAVSKAGDINGDGVDDLLIGACLAVIGAGSANTGIAYVIFGRKGAAPFTDITLNVFATGTSSVGFRIGGEAGGNQLGYAVSAAGDVNGDGGADILVAANAGRPPDIGGTPRAAAGIVYIIFGVPPPPSSQPSSQPIGRPSSRPSSQPIGRPTSQPSAQPRGVPTSQPSRQPSAHPTCQPSSQPSAQPYARPSAQPSAQPVLSPTSRPSGQPTVAPSRQPSGQPSAQPSSQPIGVPSNQPSVQPSGRPTSQPTRQPSSRPSGQPSSRPTRQPSGKPSGRPSAQPSNSPSAQPSTQPSSHPSRQPSGQPSGRPSCQPSTSPTSQPSRQPTSKPTTQPSSQPSCRPTSQPSHRPSSQPSSQPSGGPSSQPSHRPSRQPSAQPSVLPTSQPSATPTTQPSRQPSSLPTSPPSTTPTAQPSTQPSGQPSCQPVSSPTAQPSQQPSGQPSSQPSSPPTSQPTRQPSVAPTVQPSVQPFAGPTSQPSGTPTSQPSGQPSTRPSGQPSAVPRDHPSSQPTAQPTRQPSAQPSTQPSSAPTRQPSTQPCAQPSLRPHKPGAPEPSYQPSGQPTGQPTSLPSGLPTSQPSRQPSAAPSAQPTCQPNPRPSGLPSCQPSTKPSSAPTVQPSCQLSAHPSKHTALPTPAQSQTTAPSHAPSQAPSLHAGTGLSAPPSPEHTTAPSEQATQRPSDPPSGQPSARPTSRPSIAPSAHPSLPSNGEWVAVVDRNSVCTVVRVDSEVWGCEGKVRADGPSCTLVNALKGTINTRYVFPWDAFYSVLPTASEGVVMLLGQHKSSHSVNSDIAVCHTVGNELQCAVKSFTDANFLAVSYVPYPNRIVYVGSYNMYVSATIIDVASNAARSFIYSLSNMKSVVLSQVQSPPNFIGSFVAGTAVQSLGVPVNYIVAGMLRTDTGGLSAMRLSPLDGDILILNSADLVMATALEVSGPDLFIVGAFELSDGGTGSKHAYLIRANALYSTISYCVQFVSSANVTTGQRRSLADTSASSSVSRGVLYVSNELYMIVDHTLHNTTTVSVLRLNAVDGAIIKQTNIAAPSGNLSCTDIAASDLMLVIACTVRYNSTKSESLVISVNNELSFSVLPVGFVLTNVSDLLPEVVPLKRTILSVTSASAKIASTSYEFNTADSAPSRRPSAAPSSQPLAQPSSAPSAQPSRSPTSVPSVSARPTSTPSTSGPTITHKPSAVPTDAPTRAPTVVRTSAPSPKPTIAPSARPSAKPSPLPSTHPTVTPTTRVTRAPSAVPSRTPRSAPTTTPTRAPTASPTMASADGNSDSGDDRTVAIFASVGVAMFLCVGGYLVYRYRLHLEREKARNKRKVEYFRQQQLLAAAMEREREEIMRDIEEERANNAAPPNKKKKKRPMPGAGAYATGPVQHPASPPMSPDSPHSSSSLSGSDNSSHRSSSVYSREVSSRGSSRGSSVGSSHSRSRSVSDPDRSSANSSRSSSVESMSQARLRFNSSVFSINDLFDSDTDSDY